MTDLLPRLTAALAGRYAIERELGRGGMATVFLAQDQKHHRPVAIKVLTPELAAVLGADRFLREIEIAARLTHPHILPLYDSGEADGVLFYVMPYVEGESLRDRLAREKQLPLDDALQIAREVADALSYAHSHDVVHRDIKPENILLESGHAVVADFGIARAITAAGGSKLTETGMAIGTPAYMSPEQAAGSKELDGRSDLYSLGCVLYEMLAGQPPFTGPTVESVIHQHLAVEPPAVTNLRPAVPASVVAALARALAKTPADRFNPVAQFGEALWRRESVAASTAAPAPAAPPFRRVGRRALIGVVAAVALVAAAAAAGVAWRARQRADPNRRLVVVLPFENRTGDTSLNELGELAANWVADAIVRDGVAAAVPSTVVQDLLRTDLRGSATPAEDLARRTGARTAIIGEYHRNGDRIEFRGALVAMPGAQTLLALDPVVGAAGGTALLAALELRVLEAVQSRFEHALVPRTYSRPSSVEAYREFVRGEQFYIRGEFARAAEHHARAAALDTAWATPILYLYYSVWPLGRPQEADSLFRILEQRRKRLPPWDANFLDLELAWRSGDRNAAYQAARRLFEQAPRHWGGVNFATAALAINRPRDALRAARLRDTSTAIGRDYFWWYALEADALHRLGRHQRELGVALERRQRFPAEPQSLNLEIAARAAMDQQDKVTRVLEQATGKPTGWDGGPGLAYVEFLAHGHDEAARAMLPRALSTYEGFATQTGAMRADSVAFATALFAARDYRRSREWWQRLASARDTSGEAQRNLTFLAAREGGRERALRESEQWAVNPPPFHPGRVSYRRAQVAAELGDKPRAIALLRQAFAEGFPFGVGIHRDIHLQSIWNEPGFRDLMRPKD
ncbi:MAG: protein kinase [Gemmatimonadetes bacterium]|nr:protein kinase [Gemmatimonadota bacterium]